MADLNPYINFDNRAREAMEFYQSVLGGELSLNTYGEFNASEDPGEQDKIMHAQLKTEDGMVFMAADTPNGMPYNGISGISLSITGSKADEEKLRGYWDGLQAGGQLIMPLEPQVWGDVFGMFADKYGVTWMVNIAGE